MADRAKLEKIARLLDFKERPGETAFKEIEKVISVIDEVKTDVKDIQDGAMQIVEAVNILDQSKADRDEIKQQITAMPYVKGDRGFKGEKGEPGRDGKDGRDGRDGLDGKDGLKGETGARGEQGLQGLPGKDGVSAIPLDIVDSINKGDKQIKKERVEGLADIERIAKANASNVKTYTGVSETRVLELIESTPAGASTFIALTDVPSAYTGGGTKIVRVKADETGLEFVTPSSEADTLQTVTDRGATTTNDITVPTEVYGIAWDGSFEVPTKDAIYDKIQTLESTSFGTDNQIPFTNAGGTDFDYSANLTFDGTNLSVDNSNVVFNESGADVDFRIEGDTEANLLYVDAGNNRIGIGTATPDKTLTVSSGTQETAKFIRTQSGARIINIFSQPDTTDGNTLALEYQTTTTGAGAASDEPLAGIKFHATTHNQATRAGEISFLTAKGGVGYTEKVRIDEDGNVGIGTTNPANKLQVVGSIKGDTVAVGTTTQGLLTYAGGAANTFNVIGIASKNLSFGTNGIYDRMFMDTSGNVGIGTTAPSEKLDVVGDIEVSADIHNLADNGKHYFGAADDAYIHYDGTSWDFTPALATTEIVFNEGGLDTNFRIESDTNANAFFLDAGNGYIGIRTASPVAPLDVYFSTNDIISNPRSVSVEMNYGSAGSGNCPNLIYTQYYIANSNATYDGNITGRLMGLRGVVNHYGSGTVAGTIGMSTQTVNRNAGIITKAYGIQVDPILNLGAGSIGTTYGVYVDDQAAGATNWGIYSKSADNYFGGDIWLALDGTKAKFGAGDDASITYDGTDMVINPKEVGTGRVSITGGLKTDGEIIGKITTVTTTYTVLVTDATVVADSATPFTITLPTAVVGQIFTIKNINSGSVTIDGDSTDTIDGQLTQPLGQWEAIKLQCNVANSWIII